MEFIPLVNVKQQFQDTKHSILSSIEKVIESGQYILGQNVLELERKLAEKLGVSDVITVGNGTDALVLTLKAYGITYGDEVITTPYTFFATAEAISRVGAIPVFVDIDSQTYNIDPKKIEEKISPATKAIIPVHLFGQAADMDDINTIANKYKLIVIEDACQAFGATYKGKYAGNLGNAACFSFFPTKNLGTIGDGGMITTSDQELAKKVRLLRQHGSQVKYHHQIIGYNSRLDELHASILLEMLEKIDVWNEKRREMANYYREKLQHVPYIKISPEGKDRTHVYHLFCIESPERDALMKWLSQFQIQSAIYYPCPLHLQEVYSKLNYRPGDLPVAEKMASNLFAVPIGPFLKKDEQERVIAALLAFGGAT
ncbi:transcriptional regulator [Aneurinibacillus migulanus]|uniref:DegT/DnrJ/EryC1/StrS family aminotransferase n=1 Tax=Aneurinibacillus migulanus TaxID=47500 RepID=UPI0005B896AB|nr:DegT/DnrJ/EryC1/StrS family aminotransferase [Aneurinibacillus migulanus]KIV50922.1 Pleiotropic regulatory protein [Aneurinibacillus migulanus]KPD09066.1 transcriptional regulator [Aneurinibacillus migulanus]